MTTPPSGPPDPPDPPDDDDDGEDENPFLSEDEDEGPFSADYDKEGNDIEHDAKGTPYVQLPGGRFDPE